MSIKPIEKEVEKWAYDPNAPEPQQDFDIHLSGWVLPLYVKLASDKNCPKKDFFLNVLYLVTGDVASAGFKSEHLKDLIVLSELGKTSLSNEVNQWAMETENLLLSPHSYVFNFWCDEGWRNKR